MGTCNETNLISGIQCQAQYSTILWYVSSQYSLLIELLVVVTQCTHRRSIYDRNYGLLFNVP